MRRVFKIAVLFGAFLGVAGISGYLTLRFIIKSGDTVVVPQLVGKDVVYALDILTDLGLNIKVSGFEYSSELPKNHVAYQEPGPGSEVKKDRDVRVIVSKGPKTLLVPNLVGMDIRQGAAGRGDRGREHDPRHGAPVRLAAGRFRRSRYHPPPAPFLELGVRRRGARRIAL